MLEKTKKLNVPMQKQSVQIKVALIGDTQSGKSSFVQCCVNGPCPNYYEPTLGVQTADKYVQIKGGQIHLSFWDFSGKLNFLQIRNQMYKQCSLIILFVDLSAKQGLESVQYWLREVQQNGGTCPIYIVGNKSDNKKVNADFSKVAHQKDGIYVEISCKNREGVDQLLDKIINEFK